MIDQQKYIISKLHSSDFAQHLEFNLLLRTLLAPVDRVVIFQQTVPNYPYGLLAGLKSIIREEGFLKIIKGNFFGCTKIALHYATEFSIYNHLMSDYKIPVWLAGALSGSAAFFVSYPLDVKKNIVTHDRTNTIPQNVIFNRSFGHLYQGFLIGIVGNFIFSGTKFQTYSTINSTNSILSWLAGPASGLVALLLTYPFDVVKKRMQISAFDPKTTYDSSKFHKNLYGGFKLVCVKSIPTTWAMMAFNDHVKKKKVEV